MITRNTWTTGIRAGLKTSWILSKVVFPVTLAVTVLKYTPIIDWLVVVFTPVMSWIGLPGEAAIPLVVGNLLNLYAGIGAIISLELTVKHVFILAVMLSFSHNLLIETAVAKKIGVKGYIPVLLRIGLALLSAFFIANFWQGGEEQAVYGLVAAPEQALDNWLAIGLYAIKTAVLGIWQIALIVIPLMLAIQLLKDIQAIKYLSRWMEPLTKTLGLSSGKTSIPLLAGIIFGLAYGAGVIIDSAKEENLSSKDLYLLSIFLVSSHAVVEDTLIFIPLGINVLPLLLIRVLVAFFITMVTARVWRRLVIKTELITKEQ